MKENTTPLNRQLIIDTALNMIDTNCGTKNVTLREIAKVLGCAHTNLYNYFKSLDDLFWASLAEVLDRMIAFSGNGESISNPSKGDVIFILSRLIRFYIDHPGWFKLLWEESLESDPPEDISLKLIRPGDGFINIILKSNSSLTKDEASHIAELLHSCLQGEVSKWIHKRVKNGIGDENQEDAYNRIFQNMQYLYNKLIK